MADGDGASSEGSEPTLAQLLKRRSEQGTAAPVLGRPLWWMLPDTAGQLLATLVVENFGPMKQDALQLCADCADTLSKCKLLRTFALTRASVRRSQLQPQVICQRLTELSAVPPPRPLLDEIQSAGAAGVATLVYGAAGPEGGVVVEGSLRDVGRLHELVTTMSQTTDGVKPPGPLGMTLELPQRCGALPYWENSKAWVGAPEPEPAPAPAPPATTEPADSIFAAPPVADAAEVPADVPEDVEPAPKRQRTEEAADGSDSDSCFSFEGRPAAALPTSAVSAAAVALAGLVAAARSISSVRYHFIVSEDFAGALVDRAAQLGVPITREWVLSELHQHQSQRPFPVFAPKTPRWAVAAARKHQRQSLSRAFVDGRFRSGVICLPCGAGKTMVGVLAAAAASAPCVVLCSGGVAVEQWAAQFARWADLHSTDGRVARLTGKAKDPVTDATQVVLTTYSMLVPRPRRRGVSDAAITALRLKQWGLCVADEVHMLPADSCTAVLRTLKVRGILGLTATLVREDDRIHLLEQLIGPRLFEADWQDLANRGVLARAACRELRCPLSSEFAAEYRAATQKNQHLASLIAALCPSKLRCVAALVQWHEMRGDKSLVFVDSLFVLSTLSALLRRPAVSGATPLSERLRLLSDFQQGRRVNTLIVSRIGDCAIDLPAASVIIQVAAHFGSRRQEAQRMGRILRPKGSLVAAPPWMGAGAQRDGKPARNAPNALFYSLVTQDTAEVGYARRRSAYLEEQGYNCRMCSYDDVAATAFTRCALPLSDAQSRVDLLAKGLVHWRSLRGSDDAKEQRRVSEELNESPLQAETPADARNGVRDAAQLPPPALDDAPAERTVRSLSALSLSDADLVYGEWELDDAECR